MVSFKRPWLCLPRTTRVRSNPPVSSSYSPFRYTLPKETSPEEQLEKFFFVTKLSEEYIAEHGEGDVSSTQVQKLMNERDPQKDLEVSKLLHPAVEAALRKLWNLPK